MSCFDGKKVKVNENTEKLGISKHTVSILPVNKLTPEQAHALVKGACDVLNGES
jgi:DNA-binding Xre family transcriptional regulator